MKSLSLGDSAIEPHIYQGELVINHWSRYHETLKENAMTWYQKKIAVNMETGERFSVVVPLSKDDLYPSMFFAYFSDVPVHTATTQCLDILDIIENIDDIQEEETEED